MFDNLDTMTILALCLIGLVISLAILYWIIRNAVSSALRSENEKQEQLQLEQTRLLSELLKHSGVDEQRIIDILDPSKPYFLRK